MHTYLQKLLKLAKKSHGLLTLRGDFECDDTQEATERTIYLDLDNGVGLL